MKRATIYFEQVPKVIAEKVLARQTGPPETDVVEIDKTVKPKFGAAVPAVRSRKA